MCGHLRVTFFSIGKFHFTNLCRQKEIFLASRELWVYAARGIQEGVGVCLFVLPHLRLCVSHCVLDMAHNTGRSHPPVPNRSTSRAARPTSRTAVAVRTLTHGSLRTETPTRPSEQPVKDPPPTPQTPEDVVEVEADPEDMADIGFAETGPCAGPDRNVQRQKVRATEGHGMRKPFCSGPHWGVTRGSGLAAVGEATGKASPTDSQESARHSIGSKRSGTPESKVKCFFSASDFFLFHLTFPGEEP